MAKKTMRGVKAGRGGVRKRLRKNKAGSTPVARGVAVPVVIGAERREEMVPPRTAEELHAWIGRELGIAVSRRALLAGSSAPFEYLAHTFFEGRGGMALHGECARPARAGAIADCVVWANRGGGKTFLGALATLLDLVFKPGIEVRILGGSMDQSKRMYAHLRRLFDSRRNTRLAGMIEGQISPTRLALKNGSECELLSQSQTSVRGTRVQKLRCDEVDLFEKEVWEAAQLTTIGKRCGEFDVRGSIDCLSTMHVPHGVMHGIVGEAREKKRALFRWGVVDSLALCGEEHRCKDDAGAPCALWGECGGRAKGRDAASVGDCGHLPVADAIAMKRRVSLAVWKSEMLCERAKRTDAVLPEFDPALHVVRGLPFGVDAPGLTWLGGMDFGWRSPTVVVWAALDGEGVLWVVDERVVSQSTMKEHIRAVKEGLVCGEGEHARAWPRAAWLGVDPAGLNKHEQTGTSNIAMMRREGLIVKARRMGIHDGLALLRARLAPAAGPVTIRIHERCAKLIESLERYHFPSDAPESDTPVKGDGFDHAVDALRYLVQNLDKPYAGGVRRYG